METNNEDNAYTWDDLESLLLLEVELMETGSTNLVIGFVGDAIASIIGSGINGNIQTKRRSLVVV